MSVIWLWITSLSSFLPPPLVPVIPLQPQCLPGVSCLDHFLQVSSCVTFSSLLDFNRCYFLIEDFPGHCNIALSPGYSLFHSTAFFPSLSFIITHKLCSFPWAAVAKNHNRLSQNNRYLFSRIYGGQASRMKV